MKYYYLLALCIVFASCSLSERLNDENTNPTATFEPLENTTFSRGDTLDVVIEIKPTESNPYYYMIIEREYYNNGDFSNQIDQDTVDLNRPFTGLEYRLIYIVEDTLTSGAKIVFEGFLNYKNPDNSGFDIGDGILGMPEITIN